MSGDLTIRRADDARGRRRFLDLPFQLYRDDPCWVPPLRRAASKLHAGRTAFFQHAEMALFLAQRGGRDVGRVAAIHNQAHNAHHGDRVGFFGFFECRPDDGAAAGGLLAAAEDWLRSRGLTSLRGPVNPSMNAECGLLVDGFGMPPFAMMPYNPPAYAALLESAGLRKCKDLYALRIIIENLLPGTEARQRLDRLATALHRRHPEVALRPVDMRNYKREVVRFMGVFEEARRNNWGYVPVTERELLETAGDMKGIIDPEIVLVAEVDGEPAGALLAIPNINRSLAVAKGRLGPLGLFRFLREMRHVMDMRVFGVAALEKHRLKGITALLFLEVILRGSVRGYRVAEASWILEDNQMSDQTITNAFKPEHYKTYRIYEKAIAAGPVG
jgi:hypothetical protein